MKRTLIIFYLTFIGGITLISATREIKTDPIGLDRIYFIDLETQDTFLRTELVSDLCAIVTKRKIKETKYDLFKFVRVKADGSASIAVILPIANGKKNTYLFNRVGVGVPIGFYDDENPLALTFDDNAYLKDYTDFARVFSFITPLAPVDTVATGSKIVDALYKLNRKYPSSKLVGYYTISLQSGGFSDVVTKYLPHRQQSRWNTIVSEQESMRPVIDSLLTLPE